MKTRILEKEPFLLLNPADVAAYLKTTGWVIHDDKPGFRSIWQKDFQGETADLLLPADRTIGDYCHRMVDAIRLVAAIEQRSETELLSDLQLASTDVLRVRLAYSETGDGTIPLLQGEQLVQSARELCVAAALAVNSKRAYFPTNRPKDVQSFVQNLRLGQSERGSFVITVLSRVPPELALFGDLGVLEPPFERKALVGLNHALGALHSAVQQATTKRTANVFKESVSLGVSANLCGAIVGMSMENAQPADQLQFGFTWARSRPIESPIPREIVFRAEMFPIIQEASRVLKATTPQEGQEIQGYVVKLQHRDNGGIATIATVIDGQPRKVTIELPDDDHKRAIDAYEKRVEICCRGMLTRAGQVFALKEPGRLYLVADVDD